MQHLIKCCMKHIVNHIQSMPWLACKPFGDIHNICPQANTPILVLIYFCGISISEVFDIQYLQCPDQHFTITFFYRSSHNANPNGVTSYVDPASWVNIDGQILVFVLFFGWSQNSNHG